MERTNFPEEEDFFDLDDQPEFHFNDVVTVAGTTQDGNFYIAVGRLRDSQMINGRTAHRVTDLFGYNFSKRRGLEVREIDGGLFREDNLYDLVELCSESSVAELMPTGRPADYAHAVMTLSKYASALDREEREQLEAIKNIADLSKNPELN